MIQSTDVCYWWLLRYRLFDCCGYRIDHLDKDSILSTAIRGSSGFKPFYDADPFTLGIATTPHTFDTH